jgi:hypothetical protein
MQLRRMPNRVNLCLMSSAHHIVLDCVLRALRPLVRLLLRHGVTYPAFAAASKRVFIAAAQAELQSRAMPVTDSAVTLLCGVHRRDVRTLTRGPERAAGAAGAAAAMPLLGLVGQVVARWMSDADYLDRGGRPRTLGRGPEPRSFDTLVASVSSDVRPRALQDEMLRLGVLREDDTGLHLATQGFAPRQGLAETALLVAHNLHDHAAAATANLQGGANYLEQAISVDQLTPASVELLHIAAKRAWTQAFQTVMSEAQLRFDHDAAQAPAAERRQRARFGVYFFNESED